MTREEAIYLLRNTAWLGTHEDREKTEEAVEMAISALEQEPCELLILKSDIFLHQDDEKKWAERIEHEKAKGLIILPPYFTPLLVPNDVEIRIEQQPCEDAISREAVIDAIAEWVTLGEYEYSNATQYLKRRISSLPSVQPSRKGHWIIKDRYYHDTVTAECSECGREVEIPTCMSELMYKGCPYCLAEMESEE